MGQLGHRPLYHPIILHDFTLPTPIQIGTEQYFEWKEIDSPLTLVAFHIIIHPTFAFPSPQFNISGSHLKNFPIIHCLWNDCPHHLDRLSSDYIENVLGERYPDQHLDLFTLNIDWFITSYYKPVTPYPLQQDIYPLSPTTPISFYLPPECHLSSED